MWILVTIDPARVQVERVALDSEISGIKLFGPSIVRPSMNMGLFGVQGVLRLRDYLLRFSNGDYSRAGLEHAKRVAYEGEDGVWKEVRDESGGTALEGFCDDYGYANNMQPYDVYGRGVLRMVTTCRGLDVFKAQANWGQPGSVEMRP